MTSPTARFRIVDGVTVPSFFYGTAWKEDRTRELVTAAIAAGFRAVDTANQRRHYVEAGVGQALSFGSNAETAAASGPTRDQIFLQTKFTYARGQDHRLPYDAKVDIATQVEQSFQSSLEHLGVSAIDSYLLHGPWAGQGIAREDREAWRAMETLRHAGKARFIGISNVSLAQLTSLVDSGAKPAFVQNRCYARDGWDAAVRAFCRAHGIVYQAFSLLTANRGELASPAIATIAHQRGRTPAQVVFRFALQVGMIPLTGTSSPDHMRADLSCLDAEPELSDAEVDAVARSAEPLR
jgi:diketogulonate reductase-like aldo/keto reductase